MPDDLGLNKILENNYGHSIDGRPLFRLLWSTGVTEKRTSHFIDMIDDMFVRDVIETREVLKYPFAQDRWVLERLVPVDERVKLQLKTDDNWSYEEIYVFQSREGKFLPLSEEATMAAIYLFFKFYLEKTPKERMDMRMAMLAQKDLAKRNKTRDLLGDGASPFSFVLEK